MYGKLCKNMQRTQGYTVSGRHLCATTSNSLSIPPLRLGMQLWRRHSPRIPWCNLWGQSLWMSRWCQARVCINGVKLAIWMTGTPHKYKTKYEDILSKLYLLHINERRKIDFKSDKYLSVSFWQFVALVGTAQAPNSTERGFQIRCWYLDWLLWQEFQFPI